MTANIFLLLDSIVYAIGYYVHLHTLFRSIRIVLEKIHGSKKLERTVSNAISNTDELVTVLSQYHLSLEDSPAFTNDGARSKVGGLDLIESSVFNRNDVKSPIQEDR